MSTKRVKRKPEVSFLRAGALDKESINRIAKGSVKKQKHHVETVLSSILVDKGMRTMPTCQVFKLWRQK